ATYRGWGCDMLNRNVESFEKERLKATDKRSWQWNIDAMNQIRTEKNCSAGAVQQTNATAAPKQNANETPVTNPNSNTSSRKIIGIFMVDLTPAIAQAMGMTTTSGVAVVKVVKDFPAEKAGIQANDVILEVSGQPVSTQKQAQDIITNMRLGYKTEIQILRNNSRKTFMVEVVSGDNVASYNTNSLAELSNKAPVTPITTQARATTATSTGPIVYSYCWYTSVENRKHWTSSVFSLVQTPSVNQTNALAEEFRAFLDARYHLGEREGMDTICQLFDTQEQATKAWDKTRKIYRFDTVENNEIVWKPAN
ncbi:MAG: PDZ domain-containing protein, partial [Methylotenera sp.]|nr:PDZ domain-containing protein [Methylotenera sp.]